MIGALTHMPKSDDRRLVRIESAIGHADAHADRTPHTALVMPGDEAIETAPTFGAPEAART